MPTFEQLLKSEGLNGVWKGHRNNYSVKKYGKDSIEEWNYIEDFREDVTG